MGVGLRRVVVGVAALALAGALGACQPPPSRPVLVVTTTSTAPDANPGDGVCEATAGTGDCGLPAAFEEANALGEADLDIPSGYWYSQGPVLVVTGGIRINPERGSRDIGLGVTIQVSGSGTLSIDGAHTIPPPGNPQSLTPTKIVVDGLLVVRRSSFLRVGGIPGEPVGTIAVNPGGIALVDNSVIGGVLQPSGGAINNQGTVLVRNSAIYGLGAPAITTGGSGTTRLTASVLVAGIAPHGALMVLCTGTAPVSGGYNIATDATCGLSETGDLQNTVQPFDGPAPIPSLAFGLHLPSAGSPAIDRVPVGTAGCGVDLTSDHADNPRPTDGDGDGTPACDSGPGERPPSS